MFKTVRLFATVSRAEFLLPNLGSLIMGLAWGANPPLGFTELVISVILSFTILNLSSAIGAQANTISDYELDSKDDRKKQLVDAMDSLGRNRLKLVLIIEFLFALALVLLFTLIQGKPLLLIMWTAGISLGCAYSVPPFRLKARSWLALGALILVLAVLPVLFAYYTFTSELNPLFLLSLTGLALTVYAVIIPTETRDYFGDKAMGIETMTVHLDLVRASLLGLILLTLGGTFTGTAFFFGLAYGHYPVLNVFLLAVPVAVFIVLRKFKKLYSLSKEYVSSKAQNSVAQDIVSLSARNPQWIMLITQTYSFISIMLLMSKFLP
jgi:4-hydroxybenzoate polyprenyltransferase